MISKCGKDKREKSCTQGNTSECITDALTTFPGLSQSSTKGTAQTQGNMESVCFIW